MGKRIRKFTACFCCKCDDAESRHKTAPTSNYGTVQNQVGHTQNVQGSQFFGPVNNINNHFPIEEVPDVTDKDVRRSLAFPEMFDRKSNIEQPHPDTCQWIFNVDEYKDWCSRSSGLLWVKGKPGAGKSTLMLALSRAHAELDANRKEHIHLNFFFNARGTQLQQTPLGMLRSLTSQLLEKDSESCTDIKKEYTERRFAIGNSTGEWEWQRPDLEHLFMQALLQSAQQRPVTIFVDALDEAGQPASREIARYFHQINDHVVLQSAAVVKICISSRHYPIPSSIPGLEIRVEDHNGGDITTFVKDRLKLDRAVEDIPDLLEWQKLAEELIQAARGIFQWIRLTVAMVENHIDDGELPQTTREWLRLVPRDLREVYDYILCHVIDPRNRRTSSLLFQWMFLAFRPLSLHELRYALAISETIAINGVDVRGESVLSLVQPAERLVVRIKALSGGLLEVIHSSSADPKVQVIHQSVKDYIIAEGLKKLESLETSLDNHGLPVNTGIKYPILYFEGHEMLFWTCLLFLSVKLMEMSDPTSRDDTTYELALTHGIESEGLRRTNEFSKSQDPVHVRSQNSFFIYTVACIFDHALAAGEGLRKTCASQIELLHQIVPGWCCWHGSLDKQNSPDRFERWTPDRYLNIRTRTEPSLLHIASWYGIVVFVDYLVSGGCDIDLAGSDGSTALHVAAACDHHKIAELLVNAGADIDAKTKRKLTPLVLAIAKRHISLAWWLLEQQASVNISTGRFGDALQTAAQTGDLGLVEALISKGADVNAQRGGFHTPLVSASYYGHSAVVESLLRAGADINIFGERYGTALHASIKAGHTEVVDILLSSGADVHRSIPGFFTPLAAALHHSHNQKILHMCINTAVDSGMPKRDFDHALFSIVWYGQHLDAIKLMLAAGANVNACNEKGRTALHLAASFEANGNNIHDLLENGASVNARDNKRVTPLHLAAARADAASVSLLIAAGADVNAQRGACTTALLTSLLVGNLGATGPLLEAKADVNIPDKDLGTALHLAIWRHYVDVVKQLINAGADINASGEDYLSPLSTAINVKSTTIADLLVARGANLDPRDTEDHHIYERYVKALERVWILIFSWDNDRVASFL